MDLSEVGKILYVVQKTKEKKSISFLKARFFFLNSPLSKVFEMNVLLLP